ncbi:MAG: L-histidine N(alpha)-methyltransferase [Bacteroidales bacterium]
MIHKIAIKSYLHKYSVNEIRNEIFAGLSSKEKNISSKYFYNSKGSELFEKITQLPEYYPTRTEKQILKNLDLDFIPDFKNLNIWELGSGDYSKISLIISHIPKQYRDTLVYYPVDISKSAIQQAAKKLLKIYPEITIQGIVADFMHQLDVIQGNNNQLFCFLGSTIGNFHSEQRFSFLHKIKQIMKEDDFFLLGIDTIKSRQTLEAAYNDKQGITARFNLNILNVVNDLCGTNLRITDFKHIAYYNESQKRVEMHLEAVCDVSIKSRFFQEIIVIRKGERIHTENSYKFDDEIILELSEKLGFHILKIFSDNKNWFNVVLLKKR